MNIRNHGVTITGGSVHCPSGRARNEPRTIFNLNREKILEQLCSAWTVESLEASRQYYIYRNIPEAKKHTANLQTLRLTAIIVCVEEELKRKVGITL